MKNTIASLTVGLFATAAFAQTTPPAAAPATAAPQSAVSPAVAKAQATHDKETAKIEAKDSTGGPNATGKHPKKHAPIKANKDAPADAQPKTVGPTDASTSGTPTSTSK
jgi:hypothetical protein